MVFFATLNVLLTKTLSIVNIPLGCGFQTVPDSFKFSKSYNGPKN